VGSFKGNAFGLYDTVGNCWEWQADKWHKNYEGAPTDGSVWEEGGEDYRVLRGGSWLNTPRSARAAYRSRGDSVVRSDYFGFRVIRGADS